MAKFKNPETTGIVIVNWLSAKYTTQFMGAWEQVHNPKFNVMEFNNIKNQARNQWVYNYFLTLDKSNKCYWDQVLNREIWWYFCTQRHSI